MINIKPPYLGCAYYPEDWPVEEIEKDAAKMKATGIQVARIAEFAWSCMERTEGVFTFDWLHRDGSRHADGDAAHLAQQQISRRAEGE